MKLLVIGIDALDYNYVMKNIDMFPGFQVMNMEALVPLTGSAWTTIYTGQPEKNHGITSVHGVMDTDDSKSFLSCRETFLWDYLQDLHLEIFGMPVTYPPKKVKNGFMVSGELIPSPVLPYAKPRELQENFTDFYIDIWHYLESLGHIIDRGRRSSFIKEFQRDVMQNDPAEQISGGLGEAMRSINKGIINNFFKVHADGTDLACVGFSFIDRVQHWTGLHDAPVRHWYQCASSILEKLTNALKPDNVWIISDHGRPTQKKDPKHLPDGVFMYRGNDMQMSNITKCRQIDFLPTLLEFFGVENNELPGSILPIFKGSKKAIERKAVHQKLEGLGYE